METESKKCQVPYVPYSMYGGFSLTISAVVPLPALQFQRIPGYVFVGGLHIVKPLILGKLGAEPVCRHELTHIVLAPQLVGFIECLGAGFTVRLEADVALRAQKLNDIVAAALDRFYILPGLSADGEPVIVGQQSVQPFQTPQEDSFHFGHEFLHKERIVGTVRRPVLGGQHNLAAKETVRLVMEGSQRTVSET